MQRMSRGTRHCAGAAAAQLEALAAAAARHREDRNLGGGAPAEGGADAAVQHFPALRTVLLPNTTGKFRDDLRRDIAARNADVLAETAATLRGAHVLLGAPSAAWLRRVTASGAPAAVVHHDTAAIAAAAAAHHAEGGAAPVVFARANDAFFFASHFIQDAGVASVTVAFPAPFPAAGNAHRRLVTRELLHLAHQKLAPGGTAEVATDHAALHDFHVARLLESGLAVGWLPVDAGAAAVAAGDYTRDVGFTAAVAKTGTTPPEVAAANAAYRYRRQKFEPLAMKN